MQTPEPTSEHLWLQQLLGQWEYACEFVMGPDQGPSITNGTQINTALGSLWVIGEMNSVDPAGQPARSIFTLGYDPVRARFVGSFVSSCMTHLWPYDGQLDADRKILTLNSQGPSFADDGSQANYQDIFESVCRDSYVLKSRVQNKDGSWMEFMKMTYKRLGS